MHLARALSAYVWTTAALLIALVGSASGETEVEKRLALLNKIPAMEFFLAKGAPDSCGPGCDSWIAAEGRIVPETPQRLRRLLDKLHDRSLPIFFASTGGKGYEALAIGRMLRKRKMTAGVARTVLAKCFPAKSFDDCGKLLRERPDAEAALWIKNVTCSSACVYAIVGAAKREIAPIAFLGVHAAYFYPRVPGTSSAARRRREQVLRDDERRFERELLRYLAEMGISGELYRLASRTAFENVHVLSRAEMAGLGIDRQRFVEGSWNFGYQTIASVGAAALAIIKTNAGGDATPKQIMLMMSCNSRQSGSFMLTALQQLPNASTRPSTDLRISAGDVGVTLTPAGSFLTSDNNIVFEVRQQSVARGMVERLLGAPAVTVAEQGPAENDRSGAASETSPKQYSIPGTAAADTLKTLTEYCAPTNSSLYWITTMTRSGGESGPRSRDSKP